MRSLKKRGPHVLNDLNDLLKLLTDTTMYVTSNFLSTGVATKTSSLSLVQYSFRSIGEYYFSSCRSNSKKCT